MTETTASPTPASVPSTPAAPSTSGTRNDPARPRLAALDGLRFVAAFGVLLYHYAALNHHAWGQRTDEVFPDTQRWAVFGSFGVQLFFIVSGFVILMSAQGRGVRSFTASRIGRLFPAYWVSVILGVVLFALVSPGRKQIDLPEAAMNLTMVQRALGFSDVESVYWTLWTELRFYVLIAVLLALGGMTRNRLVAFATLWPVAGALSVEHGPQILSTVLIAADAPLFAGGMVLCLLVRDRGSPVLWMVLAMNVALAGAYSGRIQSLRIANSTDITLSPSTYWTAIVVCFAVVALLALTPLNRISWKWLTVLGAVTYPLYLLHSSWGRWMIEILHPHLTATVTFILVTVTMVALAYLVNRYVERPLGPRLRRAVERDLDEADRRDRSAGGPRTAVTPDPSGHAGRPAPEQPAQVG
ncbi:acyltransferase family protein [Cellulosimicrobium arenosum]|uniref:Acyltransferase n=1 Tax=Cellulosimicrobium arenosum TaxID=2708133 RepID=A0A927G607_9MICO|nr:acyltransferase [Cellulosimicrobium arenosum]MBD8077493.1 acyltransferase [Cellulosimicrobium arenosum]